MATFAQGNVCRTASPGSTAPNCSSEDFVTKSIAAIPPPPAGTVTEQKNTASGGLATSGNCDNTSSNTGSPCDTHLALNSATFQGSPSNPTGTANTTAGVMMGLGATCAITPVYSGRIRFEIIGTISNSNAGSSTQPELVFGAGIAPSNGAAASGTVLGKRVLFNSVNTNNNGAFAVAGIATGLTPGTATWFDLNVAVSGGTGTPAGLSCNAMEF